MSYAHSTDPLTIRLARLCKLPLHLPKHGPGYGTPSQWAHAVAWNGPNGIRAAAARAGLLTWTESNALYHALACWPWLSPADRQHTNRVVTMLFFIRRRYNFADFDRVILTSVEEFRIKPPKPSAPPVDWRQPRTRRGRERVSLVLI